MLSDLRLALRTLAKSPGFTAVAVLTLALGIGMSTSSFSLANTFLLRTLQYPESERLVRIFCTTPQTSTSGHSPANALDLRQSVTSFDRVSFFSYDQCSLAEPGQPAQQVQALNATAEFLDLIQVQPVLGRGFAPGDDQPGKPLVVILSHRIWKTRYAADSSVIGRDIRINGENSTIIGVLPPHFDAPLVWFGADFLRPFTIWNGFPSQRSSKWINCVGRLKLGIDLAQAQTELTAIATRLDREYPQENGTDGLRAVPLHASNMDGVTKSICWLLTGLALLVLLIACANLAGLLLARSLGRTREFAVRSALGARRWQLAQPLLTESMLLALAGGALGLLFASWSTQLIGAKLSVGNGNGLDIPLDGRVLLFASVTAIATGLIFGLVPAVLVSRTPPSDALKEGARGSSAGRAHHRFKCALVVGEVALALVIVGIAASFAIATRNLLHRDLGWQPAGLYEGALNRPWNRYGTDDLRRASDRALLERLSVLPGVQQVALCNATPLFPGGASNNLLIEGRPAPPHGQEPLVLFNSVSPDYFSILKVPLKQGTIFTANHRADSPAVIIVNEALARSFWPGENPIGKRVRTLEKEEWLEVIGVVGSVRSPFNLSAPPTAFQAYRPVEQLPGNYITIALRTTQPPAAIASGVRQTVAALDPDLPLANDGPTTQLIEQGMSNLDIVVIILGLSAVMGLLIAALGIYGIISHITAERTREFGVRIALGAQQPVILQMVLNQGTRLLVLGLVAGVAGAYGLNKVMQQNMSEFGLPGLWIQGLTVVLLSLITLLACWLPARRAMRIHPVEALRAD